MIAILDSENVYLDTYITIFVDSEDEIYGFYVAAILKPQERYGDIIWGGGSYQKCEPKIIGVGRCWKQGGAKGNSCY